MDWTAVQSAGPRMIDGYARMPIPLFLLLTHRGSGLVVPGCRKNIGRRYLLRKKKKKKEV